MTIDPAADIDTEHFSVRRTVRIDAAIDKVWAAVTDPDHISQWFGRTALDGTGPGATGTMTFDGHGAIPLRLVDSQLHRSVTYRWNNDDASGVIAEAYDDASATQFTFTLEPFENGTSLTVVETGFDVTSDPAANMEAHAGGWTSEIDKLVALLDAAE